MTNEENIISVSHEVIKKLETEHDVSIEEIEEAFFNSSEPYPIDKRPEHKTTPPTQYFIAPTFSGRYLKVVFILRLSEQKMIIKTAFDPEPIDFIKYLEAGGKLPWV